MTTRSSITPEDRALVDTITRVGLLVLILGQAAAGHTDSDIWGHMAIGLDMLRDRHFLWVDPYSFTHDQRWINHEWLWDLLVAGIYRIGGLPTIVAFRAFLVGVVLWSVDRATRHTPGWLRIGALCLVAIGCAGQWRSTRPQMATLAAYAILLAAIRIRPTTNDERPFPWWLPLLFLVWANLHGGWLFGFGAVAAYALLRPSRRSIALATCCAAATLINPYGYRLWAAMADATLRGWADLSEWQPVWRLSAGADALLLWLLLAVAVATLWRRVAHDRWRWAWTIVSLAAAANSRRLTALAAVSVAMLLVPAWTHVKEPVPVSWTPVRRSVLATTIALAAAFALMTIQPTLSCFPPIVQWEAPEPDAVAFLRQTNVMRIVPHFDFGEYAIFHLRDRMQVAIDNRRETVYSDAAVQANQRFTDGQDADYPDRIGADAVWWPVAQTRVIAGLEEAWMGTPFPGTPDGRPDEICGAGHAGTRRRGHTMLPRALRVMSGSVLLRLSRPFRALSAGQRALLVAALILHAVMLGLILREPLVSASPATRSTILRRLYHDVNQAPGPAADLFAVYLAGLKARAGASVFDAVQRSGAVPYAYSYRYLPFTAQSLGRILAALGPEDARLAWVITTELCLLIVVFVGAWHDGGSDVSLFITLGLLLNAPYWLELYMGQFTFVAAALAVVGISAWPATSTSRRSDLATVAALTAAALLKVYPLVVLAALVRTPRGRTAAAAVVLIVVLLNAPTLWADPLAADAFWSRNFVGDASGMNAGNHSALYLVYQSAEWFGWRWSLPTYGRLTLIWRVVVLLFTAVVVFNSRASLRVSAATLLIAHFLSYYQLWEHHLSAVVVAAMLLLSALGEDERRRRAGVMLAVALIALPSPFALLGADAGTWNALERLLPPMSKAVPLVMLYVIAVASVLGKGNRNPGRLRTSAFGVPGAHGAA